MHISLALIVCVLMPYVQPYVLFLQGKTDVSVLIFDNPSMFMLIGEVGQC